MATIYIDPSAGTNGAGTFADPKNTWASMTWTAGDVYLQKEGTTYSGAGSISPSKNDITFGTYDAGTGAQIQSNTRHATIFNSAGNGINTNTKTGIVIDNLRIESDTGNCIHSFYTNSDTPLNLTIKRCRVIARGGTSFNALRVRGAGLLVEDSEFSAPNDAAASTGCAYLESKNVTLLRSKFESYSSTALVVSTTSGAASSELNLLVEQCEFSSYGTGDNAGDGATIFGKGVVIRDSKSLGAWDNAVLAKSQNIIIERNYFVNFDLNRTSGDGIQLVNTHDMLSCVIRNNTIIGHVSSPVKQCIIVSDSPAAAQTTPPLIHDNYLYGMAFGIIVNAPSARVFNNKIVGQTGGGIVLKANNQKAYSNVLLDVVTTGISLDSGPSGCVVTNNTIVGSKNGINVDITNGVVKNNLFRVTVKGVHSNAALATLDNNIYEGATSWYWNGTTVSDLASWQSASGQDLSSSENNSNSTPEGRPRAGSPLLTSGADLGYLRDITGKQCRKHIGAYGAARLVPVDGS